MSLSYDLGPRVVIVQAGKIPEDVADPRAALLTESLTALGQHGDRTGTTLALETGLESGAALRQFLDLFDSGGLGVNFDPANLLMQGFDPITGALVDRLGDACDGDCVGTCTGGTRAGTADQR